MSRDIHVYAIAHDQPDGHFLVREKGRPDRRLAIPKDMSRLPLSSCFFGILRGSDQE
jgi:hypothetical protein